LDSIRYYFCASVTYGADISFSEVSLVTMHNSELADILGNLVHRVLNLCQKYCGGVVPDTQHDPAFPLPFDLEQLIREASAEARACSINTALFKAMEAARATNRYQYIYNNRAVNYEIDKCILMQQGQYAHALSLRMKRTFAYAYRPCCCTFH
jgi:methionyl-tRNA synthetase